jgi:protein arginine N-methyltransferase 1
MSLLVDSHRQYLSDRVRVDIFAKAIPLVVRPGDVVLDIGTGTGLLGLLACRAGARRVYAIEAEGTAEIARSVAARNGAADRLTVIHGHSSHVAIPEPVDVVMSDLLGHMGWEAGVFEVYAHARKWLAPGARALPSSVTILAAPVEHPDGFRDAHFWGEPVAGLALDPVLRWSLNTGYPFKCEARQILSSDRVSATFPSVGAPAMLPLSGEVVIMRRGTVHGVAGWFSAEMAPGVTLTNDPITSRLNRRQVYLPLERAVDVEAGDRVSIRLRIRPADMLVSWTVEIHAAAGVTRESHSTLEGMLITREELRSHDPDRRPRLTDRGQARATVLALCDGRRTLAEIEREVHARHAALFATPGDAQAFVAEVVSRYGAFDQV